MGVTCTEYPARRGIPIMTTICDLPHDVRFAFRRQIEAAGGEIRGYQVNAMQVAEPTDYRAFRETMQAAGWTPAAAWYFPLGSDHAPDALRHDASYPGSRGFWRLCDWTPPTPTA
jgi:hypothetical protein